MKRLLLLVLCMAFLLTGCGFSGPLDSIFGKEATAKRDAKSGGLAGSTFQQTEYNKMQKEHDDMNPILKAGDSIAYGVTSVLSGLPLVGGFAKNARDSTPSGKLATQKELAAQEAAGNAQAASGVNLGGFVLSPPILIAIIAIILILLFLFLKRRRQPVVPMMAEPVSPIHSGGMRF